MIYTTRNPKDSILSLYKLLLWFRQFDGVESPFKTFFDMFMKGEGSKDFRYCKALIYIFGGYFYLALLVVKRKYETTKQFQIQLHSA